MSIAAFVLALCSLVIATASLGWQVSMWLLTAGRPRVRLKHGLASPVGSYLSYVPKSGAPADLYALTRQGISGEEVVAVQVANVGRIPLVITGYSLALEGGTVRYHVHGEAVGPTLPHTIDPGASAMWMAPMERATRLAHASTGVEEHRNRAFVVVETGLGRAVRTKTAVDLAEARRRNGHE
ncbi:hypothetical protein RDV89_00965 [Nocardioides zeae]|uniref:Phosphoribosylamine--glycine ligase n=1 Tax=Nocardioides imazamoxiresistens TaxID=3231893 RepID=A0ABU3PQX5_9ACTN|nr:hypothetical protein [Nocardioides zeae]MDT9591617.1 hypothetical protein [Nocardioides zeae]